MPPEGRIIGEVREENETENKTEEENDIKQENEANEKRQAEDVSEETTCNRCTTKLEKGFKKNQ